MFANPVHQAYIRPYGSPAILGNFRVTATFGQIDSFHPPPGHGGVDIGNGKCGEPLLAMATGRISMAEYLDSPLGPKTALTVRLIPDAHPDFELAIAHCASLSVKVGQHVTAGQTIGVLGSSGTTACHAHLGCKQLIAGKWVSIDIWPLLNQNQQEAVMPSFKASMPSIGSFTIGAGHALVSPADPRLHFPQAAGARFAVYAALDLKTGAGAPVDIDGNSPAKNSRDQVYLVDAPNFGVAAYALRQDGTFTPSPPGHTDVELSKAAHDAAQAVAAAAAAQAKLFP